MKTEKIELPEDVIKACRELAKTARDLGLTELSGRFKPPYTSDWNADVAFAWQAGRHQEESNEIRITSQYFVNTTVNTTHNE